MSEDRVRVREIAWAEIFPWVSLFRSFRIAIQVKMLFLATVGLLTMLVGWNGLSALFSGVDDPWQKSQILSFKTDLLSGGLPSPSAGSFFPDLGRDMASVDAEVAPGAPSESTVAGVWNMLSAPFRAIFDKRVNFTLLAFYMLCALWAAGVWALFGGAITRIAAVKLSRDQRVTLKQGLAFARRKWWAYFAAPFFPLVGIFMSALPMIVAGLLMRSGFGLVVMGLLWPLMLVAGVLMAILLLGLLFGWPLMWPTISTEGLDSFDALNHSYSYAFQRPLRYLCYVLLAIFISFLGGLLVWAFAWAAAYLPAWAASWGSGSVELGLGALPAENGYGRMGHFGVGLIQFWVSLVRLIAWASFYSLFWTSATAIYFLLRYDTDRTEPHEIFLEETPDAPELTGSENVADLAASAVDAPGALGDGEASVQLEE